MTWKVIYHPFFDEDINRTLIFLALKTNLIFYKRSSNLSTKKLFGASFTVYWFAFGKKYVRYETKKWSCLFSWLQGNVTICRKLYFEAIKGRAPLASAIFFHISVNWIWRIWNKDLLVHANPTRVAYEKSYMSFLDVSLKHRIYESEI